MTRPQSDAPMAAMRTREMRFSYGASVRTVAKECTKAEIIEWLQKTHDDNYKLLTALRRIASLDAKNVPKYAQEIAREACSNLP